MSTGDIEVTVNATSTATAHDQPQAQTRVAFPRAGTVVQDQQRVMIALSDRAPISIIDDEWIVIARAVIPSNLTPPGRAGAIVVRKRWSDVVVYGSTPESNLGYVARRGRMFRVSDRDLDDLDNQHEIAKAIMVVATELHSMIAGYDCIQALPPQEMR